MLEVRSQQTMEPEDEIRRAEDELEERQREATEEEVHQAEEEVEQRDAGEGEAAEAERDLD